MGRCTYSMLLGSHKLLLLLAIRTKMTGTVYYSNKKFAVIDGAHMKSRT